MAENNQTEKQNTPPHPCTQGPRIAVIEKSLADTCQTLREIKDRLDVLNEDLVNRRIHEATTDSTSQNFMNLVNSLQQTLEKNREYIEAKMDNMVDIKTYEHHRKQVNSNTDGVAALGKRISSVEDDRQKDVTRIRTAWKMITAIGIILGMIVSIDRITNAYITPEKKMYKQIELLREDLRNMKEEENQDTNEPSSD